MSSLFSQCTRTHPYSLIPIAVHNPELVCLMRCPINRDMVDYVARHAAKCVSVRSASHTPPLDCRSLSHFIIDIINQCRLTTATLLSCLIYFDRLRAKMSNVEHASSTAMHRVFFATLIVASKYLNDSSPKNMHWAGFATKYFSLGEVNLMERQLLHLLDFDLRFTEEEACLHFAPFMASAASHASTRASAVDKVAKASKARYQSQSDQQSSPTAELPSPSVQASRSSTSTFASSVRGLAKRLSMAHLRVDSTVSSASSSAASSTATSPAVGALSSRSSSTCSSEAGSLMDDTGSSSSSSSSGWTSCESESECEDYVEPRVFSASATSYGEGGLVPPEMTSSRAGKKPFILRPTGYRPPQQLTQQRRSRMPSDTSSICTITACSPVNSSLSSLPSCQLRRPSKRTVTGSMPVSDKDDGRLNTSVTMPAMPRAAASGSFLSRMWGAAKGQAYDKTLSMDTDLQTGTNALKRLVLVNSRSTTNRTGGAFNV